MRTITLVALLCLPSLAGAQSITERLENLERNTECINSLLSRVDSLERKIEELTARPKAQPERAATIQCHGRTFVWDDSIKRYRPGGAGWYWHGESASWCRYVAVPVTSPAQYHAPAWRPMSYGNFGGGGCQPGRG